MADVTFLGFSTAGFPAPDVTRDVRPTNAPEVANFGETKNVVSAGQTAGVNDDPSVTFSNTPAPQPQSVAPATGIKQSLSANLRNPYVPPAPAPTPLVFEATLDTGPGGLDPIFQFVIVGQFVRFLSETLTPALRGVAGRILSITPGSASDSRTITLDAPLPAAPVAATGPSLPHDVFFIEEDPTTIKSNLFGANGIVSQTPEVTIKTTIPGKEVILS